MLAKPQRYSFKNGIPQKSTSNQFYVLRYEPSEEFNYAVVVSKKVAASSVDRNFIKRLYRRVILSLVKQYSLNVSLVFYVRKRSSDVTEEALYENLEQMLKKEGIISQ
jgi:ribonuclease P protein component